MPLTTKFVKLFINSRVVCIKDFPDIDPRGEIDQIEVTTLCDEYHQYIDGLKNYPDALEFTANYDESAFEACNYSDYNPATSYVSGDYARHDGVIYICTASTTGAWDSTKWTAIAVELRLCDSVNDTTGANGKFSIASSDINVRLVGGGVGDALEMVIVIKPKAPIVFSKVS